MILSSFLGLDVIVFTSVALFVSYLWLILANERRMAKLLEGVPGPPRLPFLGNALELAKREEVLPTLGSYCKSYGFRCIFKLGSSWRLLLANPKDLEIIMKSQTEITKSVEYERLYGWLGRGLLTSSGEKWRQRRKMLTNAFHFQILEQFMDVFISQSQVLVDVLKKECCNGEIVDISPYLCRCALDIICETAMGTKINAQRDRNSPYILAINRISMMQIYRAMRPWLYPQFLWRLSPSGREESKLIKTLHSFTNEVIAKRKQLLSGVDEGNPRNPGKRKLAFLDLLIEAQKNPANNLTDEDIREETDTFMFEGHDTTAANANFTVYLLAAHLEIQQKVQEELDEIFQGDMERQITMEDLSKMNYLECCLKESLRLFPSVALVGRKLQNDMRFDNDLVAPKGTTVVISPYFLHRDAKIFPDPEKFKPERFFPENTNKRDPFAYLPFVAGPRNCIGQKFAMMEEKIIIASLFRRFTFEAIERQEDLVIVTELIIRSISGIQVKLKARV